MKNTLSHIVKNENKIFDNKKWFEKCDMALVNLGKFLEYR